MGDATCAYRKIRQCRIHVGGGAKENSDTSSEGGAGFVAQLACGEPQSLAPSQVLEETRLRRNLGRRFPAASRSKHIFREETPYGYRH